MTEQPCPVPHAPRLRHDWTREEAEALLALPFPELIFQAQQAHRQFFDPTKVQISTLLSIKSGGCPEDCAYCPQSAHHEKRMEAEKLMPLERVIADAKRSKEAGAGRFCMGAAWRAPKDRDLDAVCRMVEEVKALGLETCLTIGMLTPSQSARLKDAGLDYYNHNLDTSEDFYGKIITTRTYQERLDTLANVRDAGIKICCGGIIGMGEDSQDRAGLLTTLANLPTHPESVPINLLVRVEGTPLADETTVDPITFARVIATARIMMPASHVRLAAGRESMSESTHALCFLAGANSIFWGEKLLTTPNPAQNRDTELLAMLGMTPMVHA
ncbi:MULTISPECIES: biotin synthase BioB [Bombella]|uniref:Biotin synthase n=1 Tax=Bombella pollinis TaxID=2967337 RepID=A0ABT3WQY3_9PROT|nr:MULTISPECIES: biotin synthase BioB [Bombella]MCT6855309.1 biotin synthase BioB [Bombella apis]MCX5619241.1 biotin synthase BioB [Bombella pollinis]MUG04715.1 biotin synthase BioB [Bombella sp. ESL0378]MUG90257.1 biotin synthase BioB [Bombella sp. ESL0385]